MLVSMPPIEPAELIGSAEACELLGIDRATLSRWAKAGTVATAHKLDGIRGPNIFYRADIEQLVAERAKASA